MKKNVLEWLEDTAKRLPDKKAFSTGTASLTFKELMEYSRRVGSALIKRMLPSDPVAVFMGRDADTVAAFLGVVYSGRVYAPIDAALPEERIRTILGILKPSAIVTDDEHSSRLLSLKDDDTPLFNIKELREDTEDSLALGEVRKKMVETDPLYVIFTSGSSGIPKGVITSHHALMTYISAYTEVMGIDGGDTLGGQSPLDYIAAIRDIYVPLLTGARTYLLPKEYFMQPEKLFGCMNEEKITAVGWSASSLSLLCSLNAFQGQRPEFLRKICFSGSVLSGKALSCWQENLPEALFVNQYGPTEATASCTYYKLDHVVSEDEKIPIGRPYDNYRIILIKEDNSEAGKGEMGEICVGGPALALGYYGDIERTRSAFVQNPLERRFDDRIYRTGDLGRMNEEGLLEFHGRSDRQIKHIGHRVELDEIETAALKSEHIKECASLYNEEKEVIWLFYAGDIEKGALALALRKTLPGFMVPRKLKQLEELPRLPNGKVDFNSLKPYMGL
ncbi:MAG: amino acid adenylation domain-containing protein [Lachnospiraceae bacterium]|nr:amino acid adenylation domain-containing protein [Lachnospiraceae bacterium]